MITFVIPFFNEESKNFKSLELFLKDLSKYINLSKNRNNCFLLVNDGSTDKTLELLNTFMKNKKSKKVTLINFKKNQGQGEIFRKGLALCRTKYLTMIPSDYDLPFLDYTKFIKNKADFVIFYKSNLEKYSNSRLLLSSLYNLIYNFVFGTKIHYLQGPALYNISKLKKIKIRSSNISSHSEIAIKLLHSNITYCEHPFVKKNMSNIDRSVSVKSLFYVVISFIRLWIEVKLMNKKYNTDKSKRVYI
jgi:glycosyltransferase involved in cell wall biosynthesis